jgi:hypothetical protein
VLPNDKFVVSSKRTARVNRRRWLRPDCFVGQVVNLRPIGNRPVQGAGLPVPERRLETEPRTQVSGLYSLTNSPQHYTSWSSGRIYRR